MYKEILLLDSVKNIFPIKIGTPSYVYPEDIIPNVMILADIVDEIELILFESPEYSNLPERDVMNKLINIGKQYDLDYNVHLPLDIEIFSEDRHKIKKDTEIIDRIINLTLPLKPTSFTLHAEKFTKNIRQAEKVAQRLNFLTKTDAPLCIENTQEDYLDFIEYFLGEGFYTCLDTGHIIKYGHNIDDYFRKIADKIRLFHVHGVIEEKDHRNISLVKDSEISKIFDIAQKNNASVNLEQFSFTDIEISFNKIRRIYAKNTYNRRS